MAEYNNEALAEQVIDRYNRMKSTRTVYEREWQDIKDLVRPGAADFQRSNSHDGKANAIFDGTARQACEELAGGLHSYLTNPAAPWMRLEVDGMEDLDDPDALSWLDHVTDELLEEYAHPEVRFYPSMRESYLDISSFGSCNLNQEWSEETDHLLFSTRSLASSFFDKNNEDKIDTVFRCIEWDKRQLQQRFGDDYLPDKVKQNNQKDRKWEVVHAVYPRSDREYGKIDARNMPFASVWTLVECKHVLKEGGYDSLPYHPGRWATIPEEIYGYSPAHACLPDIRMLNRMEMTMIKGAQLATAPPIFVPNDGVMLPIKMGPNSINYYENGIETPFHQMEYKGNFTIGLENSDRKREQVRKSFHLDWVEVNRKKERQSAYEIQQDEEENVRQMGPILGGLQADILQPAIARSYNLLRDHGRIRPAPPILHKRKLKVVYISPAAMAQKAMKAVNIGRLIQDATPLLQVAPEAADAIDFDAALQELAEARSAPRRVIRSPEAIAQIREGRQTQAALQQAEPVSKAIKNIADARATGMAA